MKTLHATLLVAGALLFASSCVRQLEAPPETVGTFEVVIDFNAQPSPGIALATCPCPFGGCDDTDLCPGATGARDAVIPFPGERWATVRLDITAVGTKGTRPFPVDGPVSIGLRQGEIFGITRQVTLIGGEANDAIVRIRRTPGPTHIWVEDNLPRASEDDGPPSYAVGVTDEPLWFDQPKIEDIQKTDDECCSPLQGQRVSITKGELYITRTTGNGFNIQDLTTPEWGGLFIFAFNGTKGLRVGTKVLQLDGAITEFQSATQLTEPTYVPVNGLCEAPSGGPEGGFDTEQDEQGAARPRCPVGAECVRDDEGVFRCTPDSDPGLDKDGRRVCVPGNDGTCPTGMHCLNIAGQGSFCQVEAQEVKPDAFPEAPYCGPIFTDQDLSIEAQEGSLVRITGNGPLGVRLEGLPLCALPPGDDPVGAVRSTCNDGDVEQDASGGWVARTDCTQAQNGDALLRDDEGRPCFRGNQACLDEGAPYTSYRSSCLDTGVGPRCRLADPGEPLMTNAEGAIDEDTRVCRNTLDDFLTSGFADFGQAKVFFEDGNGETRCATVNFDALTGFDVYEAMEQGVRWESVTGTMRQVRFRSNSSYWMIDVRYPEDLRPL
jgi:hypothetical protein